MSELSLTSVPMLSAGYRFQWEEVQQGYVLLYPEGMVQLNDTAAAILTVCDGKHDVQEVIKHLEHEYEADDLTEDVLAFLMEAQTEGWIRYG